MSIFKERHVPKSHTLTLFFSFFFLSPGDVVSALFITAHMVKLFGPFCDFKCKQGFHTLCLSSLRHHWEPFNHPVATTFTLLLPFLSRLSSSGSISRSHLDNCDGNILCNSPILRVPLRVCICILKHMAVLSCNLVHVTFSEVWAKIPAVCFRVK